MLEEKKNSLNEKKEVSYYVEMAHQDESWIPFLIETLKEESAIKYRAEKVLRALSSTYPKDIYPYTENLIPFLQSENAFIKWGMILTLANLLDQENLWDQVKDSYYAFLESQELVPFGNTVSILDIVLKKYPEEEKKIVPLLLEVENRTFLHKGEVSEECKKVAIGHIIDFFAKIYDHTSYTNEIYTFVKNYVDCSKESTRKKAKSLLKKMEKDR